LFCGLRWARRLWDGLDVFSGADSGGEYCICLRFSILLLSQFAVYYGHIVSGMDVRAKAESSESGSKADEFYVFSGGGQSRVVNCVFFGVCLSYSYRNSRFTVGATFRDRFDVFSDG
jgi:hypothetical protein